MKDPIPGGLCSRVVYKIVCADCNACYVGEMVQHFSTHVKDNFASDRASHIFKHLQILNIVAPCVQQIVSMFWIIPPPVFNLR